MERKGSFVPQEVYWEDISIDSELPSYSLKVTPTLIADQASGTQDYNLIHYDKEFARSREVPDIFLNAIFIRAMLCRLVTDWMGEEGWLKLLSFQMRKMNSPGDVMTVKGKVTQKYVDDDKHYVECEVWIENQREGVTTPAKAVVVLPSRGN